eukprot:COSAG06_NODE_379_length_16608_cov_83.792477_6_plen_52_part_00
MLHILWNHLFRNVDCCDCFANQQTDSPEQVELMSADWLPTVKKRHFCAVLI